MGNHGDGAQCQILPIMILQHMRNDE